jgi:hypothetical protein
MDSEMLGDGHHAKFTSWAMGRYYSRWSTGQLPRHRKNSAGLKSHAIWIMQKNPWKSSLTRFLVHVKMSNPPWSAVPFTLW